MDPFDLASSGTGVEASYNSEEGTTSLVAKFKTTAQPLIVVETCVRDRIDGDPVRAFLKAARTTEAHLKVSLGGKPEENPEKARGLIRKVVHAVSDLTI